MFELAWPWVTHAQASFEMMRHRRRATGNGCCDCPYFAEMLLSRMMLLGVGMREEQTNCTVFANGHCIDIACIVEHRLMCVR